MPTYEYRCNACSYEFEKMQMISEDRLKTCPKCNKDALERLMGAGTGLIFKGSGFYITDYKEKSGVPKEPKKESKPKSESKSAKSTDSKSSKKTESKSASKK